MNKNTLMRDLRSPKYRATKQKNKKDIQFQRKPKHSKPKGVYDE